MKRETRKRRSILFLLGSILMVSVIGFLIAREQVLKKKEVIKKVEVTASPSHSPSPMEELGEHVYHYETVVVEKLIAKHTIKYPDSPENRNHNLAVGAGFVNGNTNGYILKPGEKFSWLKLIGGDTTREQGFVDAGMIINGESSSGVGGGVCEVTSSICSALYKTENKKDKKHLHAVQHTKELKYIKPKRGDVEASVAAASGTDFWFINTLDFTIRVFVTAKKGNVTTEIFSREKILVER